MTVRIMNLVAPLPHKGTDMHIADTAGQRPAAIATMIAHGWQIQYATAVIQ